MSDKFDKIKRSKIMARVKSKDTKPEIIVRKLLFGMGYRYSLHRENLPGKPDIVLPKYGYIIFVHGCFWHGCPTCKHAKIRPVNNSNYWNKKLDRNKERDKKNKKELKSLNWKVLIIWECETKKNNTNRLKNKIRKYLNKDM